jgi:hypothetical protein
MFWEFNSGSQLRITCHNKSKQQTATGLDSEMLCSCPPDASMPCTLGRARQTGSDLRTQFLEHYHAPRDERDPEDNKLVNRLGKCPYQDCGFEVLTPCSLYVYSRSNNIKRFFQYMDKMHFRGMEDTGRSCSAWSQVVYSISVANRTIHAPTADYTSTIALGETGCNQWYLGDCYLNPSTYG